MAIPVAEFSATPLKSQGPAKIQFTDESTNTPTSWSWLIIKNGRTLQTSTNQNPSFLLTKRGLHSVVLGATNIDGTDWEVKGGYLEIIPSTTGERGINKNYPVTSGLEFINKHKGRQTNLIPQGILGIKSLVSKKNRIGID